MGNTQKKTKKWLSLSVHTDKLQLNTTSNISRADRAKYGKFVLELCDRLIDLEEVLAFTDEVQQTDFYVKNFHNEVVIESKGNAIKVEDVVDFVLRGTGNASKKKKREGS